MALHALGNIALGPTGQRETADEAAVAASGCDIEFDTIRQLQLAESGNRNDRIIGRSQNRGCYLHRRKPVTGNRVAVEVCIDRCETGVAQNQSTGQLAQVAAHVFLREQRRLRKRALLDGKRPSPLAQKIRFVEPRSLFDRIHRISRTDGRTDGESVAQGDAFLGGAQGDAQGKVAA